MRILTAALLLLAGGLLFAPAPRADALPCLYRGTTHVAQHANGNVDADSRYHVLHGEAPTCGADDSSYTGDGGWDRRQADIDRDRHGRYYP